MSSAAGGIARTGWIGVLPARRLSVDGGDWRQCAADVAAGGRLLALWAVRDVSGAGSRRPRCVRDRTGRAVSSSSRLRCAASAAYPGLEAIFPCASRMQRAAFDLCGVRSTDPDRAAVAAACRLARGLRFRCERRSTRSAERRRARSTTTRSCACRVTACTRSRSGPCTPASSSRGISASRSSARKCCGSRSGWAMRTRGSSGGSPSCGSSRVTASRRGSRAIQRSRTRGPTARRSRAWPAARSPRAPRGCAALRSSSSASPIISATWARSATTRASPSASRSSRGSRSTGCAPIDALFGQRYLMDAIVPGGIARRRRAAMRAQRSARHARRDWRARSRRCARSTTSTTACATGSRARAAWHRSSPPGSGSSGSRDERAARRTTCASTCPCAPYDELAPQSRAHATAMSRRGSPCASTSSLESLSPRRAHRRRAAGRPVTRGSRAARRRRPRSASGSIEGWRGPVLVALDAGAGRRDPALSSARPVVAELAGARARDHRQHRSGLSADQQVVQPFLQRTRSLAAMLKTLRQIGSVGIVTEAAAGGRRIPHAPRAPAGRRSATCSAARCAFATSTPAPAMAASSRSTRSHNPSTTSKGSGSGSSRVRGTRICCS